MRICHINRDGSRTIYSISISFMWGEYVQELALLRMPVNHLIGTVLEGVGNQSYNCSGPSRLKLSVEITLPLIPSHQGRGEIFWLPLPWWERVGERGTNKIKRESPVVPLLSFMYHLLRIRLLPAQGQVCMHRVGRNAPCSHGQDNGRGTGDDVTAGPDPWPCCLGAFIIGHNISPFVERQSLG